AGRGEAVPVAIHRLGIDGIDPKACGEERGHEKPLSRAFDGDVHLRGVRFQTPDGRKQLFKPVGIVGDPEVGWGLPLGSQADIVVLAGLVDSDAQHDATSCGGRPPPPTVPSWNRCSRHDALVTMKEYGTVLYNMEYAGRT